MAITYTPGAAVVAQPPSPVLLFTITQTCDGKKTKIVEKTDTYANRPIYGWGSAPSGTNNLLTSEIEAADLRITMPDGTTTYDVDCLTTTPVLPQSNIAMSPIELQADKIGLTTNDAWPDGVYTFTFYYRSTGASPGAGKYILPTSVYVLMHSQVRCCLYKMLSNLEVKDCICGDSKVEDALLAYTTYKAMLYAGACGQITKANELLALVNKYCSGTSTGCSSC